MTSPVPSNDTVTVDGYVVPSTYAKLIHLAGLLLGAFLVIAPTVDSGLTLPSSLGQLAQYLSGGAISVGTVLSYMTHERSNDHANSVTYQANLSNAIPAVENIVSQRVLPFIDTEFPNVRADIQQKLTDLEQRGQAEEQKLIAAVDAKLAQLPAPIQMDIAKLAEAIKPEILAWLTGVKARVEAAPILPQQSAPIPDTAPPAPSPAPSEPVHIIGGDA